MAGQSTGSTESISEQRLVWLDGFSWDQYEPSRARNTLDSLLRIVEAEQDERALWYVKCYKLLLSPEPIPDLKGKTLRFQKLMRYLEDCPVPEVKAHFWYLNAKFCIDERRFDEGFRWLFLAKGEFEAIGYDHFSNSAQYLSGIGLYYYFFEDYRNAIKYLESARQFQFHSSRNKISTINTLGMAYQKIRSYGAAEEYFKETIQLAEFYKDSVYIGLGNGNYGNTLRLEGKSKESLPFLFKDFAINLRREPGSTAITSIYIARALLALDSISSAKRFIDISIPLSKKIDNLSLSSYPLNYYEARASYFGKTGNEKMASAYLDSTIVLRDSISLLFNRKVLTVNQLTIEAERYQVRLLNQEAEKRAAVTFRNIIIVTMLLFAIGSLYVYNQKRKKLLAEKKLKEDQKRSAESLLASATTQLNQYVISITEKSELINKINEELERLRSISEYTQEQRHEIIEQRESLIKSVILTEKDWIKFRRLFERVHPDFLTIVKIKYSDLSAAETRLLVLLKLGISNKEMAFILGVSVDAIRKSRQRLRKKLEQTEPGMELRNLIAEL